MEWAQIMLNPESYVLLAAGASARPVIKSIAYLAIFVLFFEKLKNLTTSLFGFAKKLNAKRKEIFGAKSFN